MSTDTAHVHSPNWYILQLTFPWTLFSLVLIWWSFGKYAASAEHAQGRYITKSKHPAKSKRSQTCAVNILKLSWPLASITVHYLRCNSDHVYDPCSPCRYRCPVYPHVFQLTYTNKTRKPGVKNKIVDMAFNGAGVRDTTLVLKIGTNTVIRPLKTLPTVSNLRKAGSQWCGTYLWTWWAMDVGLPLIPR